MDEGQIENYNEWPDQNKKMKIEYEPSDNVSVLSAIENIDMPYEEIEIKNEPIDKGYILSSIENTKMEISSYIPIIKKELSETNTNSKRLKESDTDIKPETIFGLTQLALPNFGVRSGCGFKIEQCVGKSWVDPNQSSKLYLTKSLGYKFGVRSGCGFKVESV